MRNVVCCLLSLLLCVPCLKAQPQDSAFPERPKLVVVISIDQFRYDYLPRFAPFFGEGGFNLFLKDGANFANARYEHAVTKTAPGHSVILSGAYPAVTGIIANAWFNVRTGQEVYCVEDTSVTLLGATGAGRSPRNFNATTVGDVLKESTGGRARVISVSNKDRAAILMGGQLADGAYWTIDSSFVTSTYYQERLPAWVRRFNQEGHVTAYFGKTWDRLLPADAYALQGPDDVAAEEAGDGMGRTFPYRIDGGADHVTGAFFGAFDRSPFSSDVLADFAMAAIAAEQLGQRDVTDLLAVGFSANDRIGHAYGPDSQEVMDVTVRTDRILARLFAYIDEHVGLANTLIVLTADHGTAPLPEVALAQRPGTLGGRIPPAEIERAVNEALTRAFGAPQGGRWIRYHSEPNLYLDERAVAAAGGSMAEAERIVRDTLALVPAVYHAFTYDDLAHGEVGGAFALRVRNNFYPNRTGHVFYQLKPYYLEDADAVGTSHGTPWSYDAHVPMLWYGRGVRPGTYYEAAGVADIAPTLSALLNVGYPSGVQGRVLEAVVAQAAEGRYKSPPAP